MAKNTKIKATADAEANIIKAKGEAEAIIEVAKARKKEADELEKSQISKDLAQIREFGEAGKKIFTGDNNSFIFGNNQENVMNGMF